MRADPPPTSTALYRDRREAGRRLAARLERLRPEAPVVLAIPRGGVPVAAEVARALAAPLDVLVVRKAGEPGSRVGAVAEGGLAVVDHERARALGLGAEELAPMRQLAGDAADAAARRYRGGAAPRDIVGRTVLIVDDGIGTGASAIAAARTARRRGAARIVLAVPVAGAAAVARLGEEVDELVCVDVAPTSRWYASGPAVSDEEIAAALRTEALPLEGSLRLPEAARGLVILAAPNDVVRRTLGDMGFATLELTPGPDPDAASGAVAGAVDRLRGMPAAERLAVGVFGLGPTAAPALLASAASDAHAVVAAGGRPDRPGERLADVTAPALLVVGGEDRLVLRLARAAGEQLGSQERQLAVVAGATHDFAEPGALEQVAHLAGAWFARHI